MKVADRSRLYESFGSRLKRIRLSKGLTPTEMFYRSGVDGSNLRKYENGLRDPGLAIIMILAKALGVDHRVLTDFDFDFEETV